MSRVFLAFAYITHPYCQYCGCRLLYVKHHTQKRHRGKRNIATCDHFVPRSKGGSSSWENRVIACTECNQKKGAKVWEKPEGPDWLLLKHTMPKRTYAEMLPIALKMNEVHGAGTKKSPRLDAHCFL